MNKIQSEDHQQRISRSHQRCIDAGLSKDMIFSQKILSGQELKEVLDNKKVLIKTAEPFMKQLNDFVQSANFLTILTDQEGIILQVFGNDYILKEASNLKMVPGASMAENCIGTNAMGTVLVEKIPMQLVADDHFIKCYHRWTCSCAPIKDPDGKIIGTLDLTGNTDFVHPHTLGMVVAAAHALENMLGVHNYQKKLIQSKTNIEQMLNAIPAGVISTDLSGNILFLNNELLSLFGFDRHNAYQKKIWEFFEGWNNVRSTLLHNQSFLDEDVNVFANKNTVQLNLSAYPIYNVNNELDEIVFVFKDVKKVRKLADRIMGRKAVYTFDKIITQNSHFQDVLDFCKKISDSKSSILITGESGTGKEIIAQSIHNYSSRKNDSFIAVNCGAIPKTLIESELFGYVEGAFTGAKRSGSAGKFEIADGGTLFLDEIGEMPLDMQTNLLRVIEEAYITRVGSSTPIPVNVRIISATNRDLQKEVENGNFRKDLYYRLNVLPIHLPPLRERKDDIPLLIHYFMNNLSIRLNKKPIHIPHEYMERIIHYPWHGNIRELENFVELIINTERLPLQFEMNKQLSSEVFIHHEEHQLSLSEMEKVHISEVLLKNNFNIQKSASILGITRGTLYRKIDEYQIKIIH